nr:hypothetical protein [Providencia sp. JUb39]
MSKKHPNKEVREALRYAEEKGWIVEDATGHPFCIVKCGNADHGRTHAMSVNSTPKNPEVHAKQIRRMVDRCTPRKPKG